MRQYRNYKPETKSLIEALLAAGFTIKEMDDGGDLAIDYENVDQAVETLTAVDDSRLYVTPPGEPKRELGIWLVFGNLPGELVCDHHVHPLLEKVVNAHATKWDGQEQLMEEVP